MRGMLAVPLALVSGLMGGSIMLLLLARLLWPMVSKPLNKADYYLPGTAARVVSPIREGGVGEIVYTKAGSRFTAGARSAEGVPIAKGTEVVILGYERGLALVQAVDALLGQERI
jgi:membrane protein implicated in regulation of membrane protease activity